MVTPIKFGTDGWRAVIAQDFTYANLARVTQATGLWLHQLTPHPSVLLGYDCRFNGKLFAQAVANQLAQQDVKVFLAPHFASTPMVSLATLQRQTTAGIILTASHNPPEYSGFKLKGAFGGPAFPSMIAAVEQLIPPEAPTYEDRFEALLASHHIEYYDAEALYLNHLKQAFELPAIHKAGIRLGYDAMYGAGQQVMRKLFPQATLLHCEFNPGFMGQAPEPIEKNLQPFRQLLLQQKLQFGLVTDGDADRIGLFDETGHFVDSHHILLLLIHYLHKYKGLTGKVVYTFSCTDKIATLCQAYGLPVQVTKIGFKYIGEIMAQEEVLVGGEESGGIAVLGHIPERDGIYVGLLLLEFMAKTGKSLTALLAEVTAVCGPFAVARTDAHLTPAQQQQLLQALQAGTYKQFGPYRLDPAETLDGYKYRLQAGGWIMVRPSGTEPVLRIYAEADNQQEAQARVDAAVQTLLG